MSIRQAGKLVIGVSIDSVMVCRLLAYSAEQGFEVKDIDPRDEYSGLVVSMPRDTFTEKALDKLMRLVGFK